MDRNSAIGLTLMALLLLGYFYFFSPSPEAQKDKTATAKIVVKDTTQQKTETALDSNLVKQYGDLGSLLTGKEEFTSVENDVLKLTFSNTGTLNEVNLKNYKTYSQQPLFLAKDGNNKFSLVAMYNGQDVDLYQLHYPAEIVKQTDTTKVIFTANLSATSFIKHIYSIPNKGYKIGYKIESKGITLGKDLAFAWVDYVPLVEKDLTTTRNKTTVNYYTSQGSFKNLSETSPDNKTFEEPTQWVSIQQKFFLSAIFAEKNFSAGSASTFFNKTDSAFVKKTEVNLSVAANTNLAYYFGPNDHRITEKIAEEFSRNEYIGWPPVIWVNKFLTRPIFEFLQTFITNYGLVILLLVLVMKLILTPLIYSSYLGMAKMRLLKPELDIIKEKNGDNMAQAQQDQMQLYRQVGVNPFSGCIPVLLQMPILFSLFYLFPNSIDLRQHSFLWAEDLSTYDSIINLPFAIPFYGSHVSLFVLLMTASQIIYAWQQNQMTTVDGPMKMMGYITPLVFLFMFNSFSSGLSFYYFVSNLITFAQQAIIKRFVDEDKIKAIMDENKKKAATGTGKKSKFMSRLEEAMKANEEIKKKGKK